MLADKEIGDGSCGVAKTIRKRKKRGKFLFSLRKELQRSQKRALAISSATNASLQRRPCNLKGTEENEVEEAEKRNFQKVQLTVDKSFLLCSLQTLVYFSVRKSIHT